MSNKPPGDMDATGLQAVLRVTVLEGLRWERKGLRCMRKMPGFVVCRTGFKSKLGHFVGD